MDNSLNNAKALSPAMKPTRKRSLGFYFFDTAKAFHIVIRLKDVPGALSSALELLCNCVDIVASTSYSMEDGEAIWSGFVKSLSNTETEVRLQKLVQSSPMVLECEVKGSDNGLLIDSFHSGIEVAPERPGVVLPKIGVSRMFNRLAEVFGSGGETILFEEGTALGQSSGQYLNATLAHNSLDWRIKALLGMYRTYGWGSASLEVENPGSRFRIGFSDCFECAEMGKERKECGFLGGHLSSTVSALSGKEFRHEETKCRLRGDPLCEFLLFRQKP
jgi:predicted hydrocarbon binding protein